MDMVESGSQNSPFNKWESCTPHACLSIKIGYEQGDILIDE